MQNFVGKTKCIVGYMKVADRPILIHVHGTTLLHAASLRQAYDMTWDHLHAYDIFTYKIKYAKVCTGI